MIDLLVFLPAFLLGLGLTGQFHWKLINSVEKNSNKLWRDGMILTLFCLKLPFSWQTLSVPGRSGLSTRRWGGRAACSELPPLASAARARRGGSRGVTAGKAGRGGAGRGAPHGLPAALRSVWEWLLPWSPGKNVCILHGKSLHWIAILSGRKTRERQVLLICWSFLFFFLQVSSFLQGR